MREFMSYVLHSFTDATRWNRDNVYSDLNATANELLDFQNPGGLRLTLASLATPHFATSYTLGSVGVVDGSLSYLYSSVPLTNVVAISESIPLPTLLRCYQPLRELHLRHASSTKHKPAATGGILSSILPRFSLLKDARSLVDKPTLLYGRLYLPRSLLEALFIKRLSPSVQVQLMAVSEAHLRNGGTVLGMIQVDRGRYGVEGLASSDGGLLGIRGLYNIGGDTYPPNGTTGFRHGSLNRENASSSGLVDGESIYGRFSVGGEAYYGTLNKSGGISLGARFATLPAHRGTPLTATLTLNPLMGSICASYAVQAREYCSLATKFDFNVYSYESDWAVGMELWSKRRLAGLVSAHREHSKSTGTDPTSRRRERSFQAKLNWTTDDSKARGQIAAGDTPHENGRKFASIVNDEEYHGVLKAHLDQNLKVGLRWEGRAKSLLFSLGTGVDLNKLEKPFRTLGLEVQFSS